ncbi:AAA family ATPase [Vibrio splendidus]|uniref:AAA family ATPase n=1 Tax=Vibrio splendidus TaxID=29497 RepID=UPI0006CA3677|nr:AAA family ATPase [Vibrio splendidus]
MIAALFLSNYKCYENAHFLSFVEHGPSNLNILIGDNGVGKSSILEALNCVMNNVETKKWETTIGKKNNRTSIFPVFLIEKAKFKPTAKYKEQYKTISDVFWNNDFPSVNNENAKSFLATRENLKQKIEHEDYYLFPIGKTKDNNLLMTTLFDKKVRNMTKRDSVSREVINQLFKDILSHYSYIYFPIESQANDLLNLQAKELQSLMDKSVIDEIKETLDRKDISKKVDEQPAKRSKNHSVIDIINGKLEDYIDDINSKISDGYKFSAKENHKKTIKSADVIDVIINEFFSIRELTKNQKKIKNLSSGQQRIALIDIATKLLSTESEKAKEPILAIDEPESSLDSQHKFEQFSLLMKLAEKYQRNIFITTHWYGLLLKPTTGALHYIDQDDEDNLIYGSYPLTNLYDYRKHFPDSLEMKSYFDLMSSILSIIKKTDINWLICEGYEDALYLNTYINNDKIIVLPFNGNGNVKKIFEFLSVPFGDKEEKKKIKGKVFCLIDTDTSNLMKIENYSASKFDKKLMFERLGQKDNEIVLNSISSTDANTIRIEDGLNPKVFYKALEKLAESNETIKEYLKEVSLIEDAKYTLINQELQFLKKDTYLAHENKGSFLNELSNKHVKYQLALEYSRIQKELNEPTPSWIDTLLMKFE